LSQWLTLSTTKNHGCRNLDFRRSLSGDIKVENVVSLTIDVQNIPNSHSADVKT